MLNSHGAQAHPGDTKKVSSTPPSPANHAQFIHNEPVNKMAVMARKEAMHELDKRGFPLPS